MVVSRPLRFVINGQLAIAFPDGRRSERLHRIVMLDRRVVLRFDLHGGFGKDLFWLATRVRWRWHGDSQEWNRHSPCLRFVRLVSRITEIGRVRLLLVSDVYKGRCMTRQLGCVSDNKSDRLTAEQNLFALERTKRRTRRCQVVTVTSVEPRRGRSILVGEDIDHPFETLCFA